jgi:hypothetical protein
VAAVPIETSGVQVIGLRDFQRRVRTAANYEPRIMREGLNEVGSVLLEDIVQDMESQFVTPEDRRTGALTSSVRALSTAREGRVVAGYPARVPYAGWWEFGGSTKRKAGGMDREWIKKGRTMYPALERKHAEIVAVLEHVLNEIAKICNEG